MLLIAAQVKLVSQFRRYGCLKVFCQAIQRSNKTGHGTQVSHIKTQRLRPTLRQHLLNPLFLFLFPLAGFAHLLAKVVGIKCDPLEQEHRSDIIAAIAALISSHSQHRRPATMQAPLKYHRRIKLIPARAARAPACNRHGQRSVALRAAAAK